MIVVLNILIFQGTRHCKKNEKLNLYALLDVDGYLHEESLIHSMFLGFKPLRYAKMSRVPIRSIPYMWRVSSLRDASMEASILGSR